MTKTCTKCLQAKPATGEFFKRNKGRKDGWEYWCKVCWNGFYSKHYKANPELRQEKERRYAERNPEKYAAKLKRHHDKQRDQGKNKYAARNLDKVRAYERKRWADNPARRAYDRLRWERRREAYNLRQQERYTANPMPIRLKVMRRRIMKLSAPGSFTQQELLSRVSMFGWRCRYCRCELSTKTLTLDHRIPLSRGGSNWLANIVPACRSCNSKKGTKTEIEYLRMT